MADLFLGRPRSRRYPKFNIRRDIPPSCIEKRSAVGHWEIDTVIGKGAPDCVTTLVERKTGYALIGKLSDRSMFGTSQRTKMLIRRVPDQVKTITADNGTEFHDY